MKTETGIAALPYRRALAQMAIGAVVIEGAYGRQTADGIRAELDEAGFSPFRLRHLGCYERRDTVPSAALVAELHELAEYVTATSLAVTDSACLRLRQGDYVLGQAGEPTFGEQRGYELTLDVSASSSGEAQVVYARRGEHFFAAPQLAASVALVERRPSITRYDRYLNHRIGDRVVHRIRLALVRSGVAETEPPSRGPSALPKVDV